MDGSAAYIALDYWDLSLGSLLVLANAGLSLALQLGLHKRLLVSSVRMVVQLFLMGLVLTVIFTRLSPYLTSLAALIMVAFAGREVAARQERRLAGLWSYGLGTASMMLAAVLVTVLALTTALKPDPWYDPRYALPLLGMILGNTMTGVSLGMNSLTTGLHQRRAAVEARLMLGDDRRAAFGPVVRQALRHALMPIINVMSATGVVSIPGMMTGQILGGVPPTEAVKYQIMILFLIAGGVGLGALAAVFGGVQRLSDPRHRLRLDRLRTPKG
ncbi:MAG TPA: ABC transporter permease [Candidatus Sulfotelmatobacter sp.]|jgi:putative ABC transport system permease protein|nr:ABC transporter permease [Candidatus Sulfotelmatobacter sp.]